MSIPSPLTRHVDGGMLGFECATFTTHVCMRARVILVEAQKLETSKGRRAHRTMKSEKKPRILKDYQISSYSRYKL